MIFDTISPDKLNYIKHITEFFLHKDYVHKFYTQRNGITLEIYERTRYPEKRLGSYSIEQVVFVMIPRFFEKSHVMYSPMMLDVHIDTLYREFLERYINESKTEELCQKDNDTNKKISSEKQQDFPALP